MKPTQKTYEAESKGKRSRKKRKPLKKVFFDFLSGKILVREEVVRQFPYIILLTVLAFIYIGNQYHAEKIAIETGQLKREIKELRTRSISISSELLYMTNQIEISRLLNEKGIELQQATEPPVRIKLKEQPEKQTRNDR